MTSPSRAVFSALSVGPPSVRLRALHPASVPNVCGCYFVRVRSLPGSDPVGVLVASYQPGAWAYKIGSTATLRARVGALRARHGGLDVISFVPCATPDLARVCENFLHAIVRPIERLSIDYFILSEDEALRIQALETLDAIIDERQGRK